jgi:flagellum-specific peptidoglycan hydrolase FlgJ
LIVAAPDKVNRNKSSSLSVCCIHSFLCKVKAIATFHSSHFSYIKFVDNMAPSTPTVSSGTPRSSNSSRTSMDTVTRHSSTNHVDAAVPESPRRRRTRPTATSTTATDTSSIHMLTTTTTTTTRPSWSVVKQDFIKTVQAACEELMQEHGYSRERATGAVLREISDDTKGTKTAPQDIEVCRWRVVTCRVS